MPFLFTRVSLEDIMCTSNESRKTSIIAEQCARQSRRQSSAAFLENFQSLLVLFKTKCDNFM